MPAHLRRTDAGAEALYVLATPFTIGRLVSNSLPIDGDPAVSRQHAVITAHGPSYDIEDSGSRNGTFIERGTRKWRVASITMLEHGDVIQVGAAHLRFEDPAPSAPAYDESATVVPAGTVVGVVLPVPRAGQEG
ncbi:MAG: FHA domain-containing protein [Dehalococcoidia bacterium]